MTFRLISLQRSIHVYSSCHKNNLSSGIYQLAKISIAELFKDHTEFRVVSMTLISLKWRFLAWSFSRLLKEGLMVLFSFHSCKDGLYNGTHEAHLLSVACFGNHYGFAGLEYPTPWGACTWTTSWNSFSFSAGELNDTCLLNYDGAVKKNLFYLFLCCKAVTCFSFQFFFRRLEFMTSLP